jgi:hypothetical protein
MHLHHERPRNLQLFLLSVSGRVIVREEWEEEDITKANELLVVGCCELSGARYALHLLCHRLFQLTASVYKQILCLGLVLPCKKPVHVLQRKALRLRVEHIDNRQPERVQYGEDDIRLPSNIRDCWRREFDDREVAN